MTKTTITLTVDGNYTADRFINEMQCRFGPKIDKDYIRDILSVDFSRLNPSDTIRYTFEVDHYAYGGEIPIWVDIDETSSAASSSPMLGKMLLCLLLS
jgi:hypothetical protein